MKVIFIKVTNWWHNLKKKEKHSSNVKIQQISCDRETLGWPHFLMFIPLCDPLPLNVDRTCNMCYIETGWLCVHDYITKNCNAHLGGNSSNWLWRSKLQHYEIHMKRAARQETTALSAACEELNSAKKPHESGSKSFLPHLSLRWDHNPTRHLDWSFMRPWSRKPSIAVYTFLTYRSWDSKCILF